jgi:multidrug resistance efflux pump
MIKNRLDQIRLKEYKECLSGNTLILHSGVKLFKRKLRRKCDEVFAEVTNELNNAVQADGNIVFKSWSKLQQNSLKLRIYLLGYKALSVYKNAETIEILSKHGFVYKDTLTHVQNLQQLAAQIDRIQASLKNKSENYEKMIEEQKSTGKTITLEEIIFKINQAIGFNQLTLENYLSEFVAVLKIVNKNNNK